MQVLKQQVARRLLRKKRTRPGQGELFDAAVDHFWQRRFYDFNLWSARKQSQKLCYMHRNPVTRGLVSAPELWAWSSYRWYACAEAGVVKVNDWPTRMKGVGTKSVLAHPSKTGKGGAPTSS
jgi:hypothetical protein